MILTGLGWNALLDESPQRLDYLARASLQIRADNRVDIFRAACAANGSREMARNLAKV